MQKSEALLLKGLPVANKILSDVKVQADAFTSKLKIKIKLVVILVGEDPASEVYVSHKIKKCQELDFESELARLPAIADEKSIIETIHALNLNSNCHGILLQLPLPKHLDSRKIINEIDPRKDVDGLTDFNIGGLVSGSSPIASCTPSGVIEILKFYDLSVAGKKSLVIGRSLIVGLPLFHLLNRENSTVTVAHSQTLDLLAMIKDFDFVFVAAGKPHLFKADQFKQGTIVVDVGIHRLESGLTGDVDFKCAHQLKAYTPVPGGVGPLTIAMLMKNTLTLAKLQLKKI
jgi:methylenetetrahydrofolate dehydrogenase (NADP+) / methenyltetrahydrofolate cyclohydrolase